MLRRQIAVGDIHGCFDLLKALIDHVIAFDPGGDMLVFLGDYIDRGRMSREVVAYVSALRENYPDRVVLLKGNHEELALHALAETGQDRERALWRLNAGDDTISSYGTIDEARDVLLPFIESLELSYETDTHLFVHGGIPSGKELHTASLEDLLWDRSLSYQGEKILVVGHTPKSRVARFNNGKIICIDTGAYMTGILSAYDVINDTVYTAKSGK